MKDNEFKLDQLSVGSKIFLFVFPIFREGFFFFLIKRSQDISICQAGNESAKIIISCTIKTPHRDLFLDICKNYKSNTFDSKITLGMKDKSFEHLDSGWDFRQTIRKGKFIPSLGQMKIYAESPAKKESTSLD